MASLATPSANAGDVGFRQLTVTAKAMEDTFPANVWYPTTARSVETRFGPFTMPIAVGAPAAIGSYGLIVVSHGSGSGRLNHRGTAAFLAKHGYVVVAPEHPGDNWQDSSRMATVRNWIGRPRHLAAAIDIVLADPDLGPVIDRDRIGAIGHSAGGYSVLALIGGRADMANLISHCREHWQDDSQFCGHSPTGDPAEVAQRRFADATESEADVEPIPAFKDQRVRAAVVLAPVGALFGSGSFDDISAHVRLYRAGADTILSHPWHAERVAQLLPADREYVALAGVHHFAFITPFPEPIRASVGEPAEDPTDFDRAAFLRRLDGEILEFFGRALGG